MELLLALLAQDLEHLQTLGSRNGRHTGQVNAVAVHGRLLLAGDDEDFVRLWDAGTLEPRGVWKGHRFSVTAVAFSPDGRRALTASRDITIRLWDVERGRELAVWRGHGDWIAAVAFSPDGTRAVSGSCDNTVRLWKVENGEKLATWEGHGSWVTSVVFGTHVLSASWDHTIRKWDPKTGASTVWKGHKDVVTALALDGARAVSASADRTVKLWDVETGTELASAAHESEVLAVAFDGRRVLSGAVDRTVRLWDASLRPIAKYAGHADAVTSVAFAGDRPVSGSRDRTVRVWGLETPAPVTGAALAGDRVVSSTDPDVTGLDADGRHVVTVHADGSVRVDGAVRRRGATTVALHGDRFLAGLRNGRLVVCDLDGKVLADWEAHGDAVASAVFSPDGRQVLSAGIDWRVRLWKIGEEEPVAKWHTGGTPNAVAFSADGRRAAAACNGVLLVVWDVRTGIEETTWDAGSRAILGAAFAPDERTVLCVTKEGRLRGWDCAARRETLSIAADSGPLAISCRGDRVLVRNADGSVDLYRSSSRK